MPDSQDGVATPGVTAPAAKRPLRPLKVVVWVGLGLALLFLALGLRLALATQPTGGEPAPDFTLELFDGGRFSLSESEGSVVVINFWASWCGPCREEAAILEAAWQSYREDGVVFVGVNYLDSQDRALAYLDEFGISYPNGPDFGARISDMYKISGVPETFVVDANGQVTFFAARPLTYAEIQREIEQAKRIGAAP